MTCRSTSNFNFPSAVSDTKSPQITVVKLTNFHLLQKPSIINNSYEIPFHSSTHYSNHLQRMTNKQANNAKQTPVGYLGSPSNLERRRLGLESLSSRRDIRVFLQNRDQREMMMIWGYLSFFNPFRKVPPQSKLFMSSRAGGLIYTLYLIF